MQICAMFRVEMGQPAECGTSAAALQSANSRHSGKGGSGDWRDEGHGKTMYMSVMISMRSPPFVYSASTLTRRTCPGILLEGSGALAGRRRSARLPAPSAAAAVRPPEVLWYDPQAG